MTEEVHAAALAQPSRALLPAATARILRGAILSGRLPQGAKLGEPDLAGEMAISRATLREALRTLEEEGLVVSRPHRGVQVVRVTKRDYGDVLAVRTLLEPYVVEQAYLGGGAALVETLADARAEMLRAAVEMDSVALAKAHLDFHTAFYVHCGNAVLVTIWSRLATRMILYLQLQHATFSNFEEEARTHDIILQLVGAGDVVALRTAVVEHLNTHLAQLVPQLEEDATTDSTSAPGTR